MSLLRIDFFPHTTSERLRFLLQHLDGRQPEGQVLATENRSAGITPGNNTSRSSIEILHSAGNFTIPLGFCIGINGYIEALQQ